LKSCPLCKNCWCQPLEIHQVGQITAEGIFVTGKKVANVQVDEYSDHVLIVLSFFVELMADIYDPDHVDQVTMFNFVDHRYSSSHNKKRTEMKTVHAALILRSMK